MASIVIHMCVASEINKKIKVKNYDDFLLGSIAPDISKVVGWSRDLSHFINRNINNYPDVNSFLNKYKINNEFLLGYYVHLYTDYLWFKDFIKNINYNGLITLIDGTKVDYDSKTFMKYIYNDYTNLNIKLIDEYNLDLSLFSNPINIPNVYMDEIPIEKLQELLDSASLIIENSKEHKEYLFDIYEIKKFIDYSVDIICNDIFKRQLTKNME